MIWKWNEQGSTKHFSMIRAFPPGTFQSRLQACSQLEIDQSRPRKRSLVPVISSAAAHHQFVPKIPARVRDRFTFHQRQQHGRSYMPDLCARRAHRGQWWQHLVAAG
jgi:hypothetical protein